MKLTGQASQYLINLEIMRAACYQKPIDTLHRMKDELRGKHVPPLFCVCLIDEWHQYTQGNKYVTKFNEFLIRCNTLNIEGQAQILSRFRARLKGDL